MYSVLDMKMFVVVWCLALWFVFSVMWSELLMTSTISCPLRSSVYECQRVESAFTSRVRIECGMSVMYCIRVNCSNGSNYSSRLWWNWQFCEKI